MTACWLFTVTTTEHVESELALLLAGTVQMIWVWVALFTGQRFEQIETEEEVDENPRPFMAKVNPPITPPLIYNKMK